MVKLLRPAVFAGVFAFFAVLIWFNAFSHVRADITDRLYGGQPALQNILIVEIDDASINSIGRWPWDRDVHARLLSRMNAARAIGVDVSFFEPSDDDDLLNATLRNLTNVVLAAEVQDGTLYKPIFDADAGYVNLLTDPDGISRKVATGLAKDVLPFAFRIYQKGWKPDAAFAAGQHRINFAGPPGLFPSISAKDVLDGKGEFAGVFVLVGATAPDLHDEYFVPTSEGKAMPGVEIHAHILQNLILGNFLAKQGMGSLILVTLIAALLGMFALSRLKVYLSVPGIVVLIILFGIACIQAFNRLNFMMDLFYVPLALIVFTSTGIGLNYLEERRHSAFLRDAFGKYVSKDLLGQLLRQESALKLGGSKRTVTVFFSDIRGFTSISETLAPESLTHLLNEYLTAMTRVILAHEGTVDKFIGDAIMAFWNAPLDQPKHAELACKAAIEQVKALRELQKRWTGQGLPAIHIGCGIHTGPAIIGNMGSEERFDYTAIGDTINLASRLEGLTKEYGVGIIISESTHDAIKGSLPCRKLDAVRVKGRKEPVVVYELCVDCDQEFLDRFGKALALYFDGKFADAKKTFQDASRLQKDAATQAFIERCDMYLKHPPGKNWDGVFEMQTK